MKGIIKNRDELLQLINKNIGTNITNRRELLKLTRSDLSEKVGSSIESIRQYELGNHHISAARLFIIALALDMPVEKFFSLDTEAVTIDTEQDKIQRIVKEFFKISSTHLAASTASLITALVDEIKSLKEDA